jgi:hypothetical protein
MATEIRRSTRPSAPRLQVHRDAPALIGLLAEPSRMRVFAAVVLGAQTVADVSTRTGLTLREVAEALRRLADGGLVSPAPPLQAHLEAFKESARTAAAARVEADSGPEEVDPARSAVLRAFVADGRLVSVPVSWGKRRIVLEHIVTTFEPGVRYPEREVDAVLRAWYPDHATLRRHLVDEQLLARDSGVYWRIGGPVLD